VDHRADLFSLGSVLYACCTGVPPFRAATPLAVLCQVSEAVPRPVRSLNPEVPAWLEALITRLLEKDPAGRYQSAAEVAAQLEGYLAHLRQPGTVLSPELRPLPPETCAGPPSSHFRGRLATWLRPRRFRALGALATLGVCLFLLLQAASPPSKQPIVKEVYCDFRGGQPLPSAFTLDGPDANEVIKQEEKGLRITLPAKRRSELLVGVAATFTVAGDFEITSTYELLSADRPPDGNGVGVALEVATDDNLTKFGKVSRFVRPERGDVYQTEFWIKTQPGSGKHTFTPTTARAGQLRLVREGSTLRFLVAAGPANEFEEINRREFTTEDLDICRFGVNNHGSPAGVDVRLIDLRIRSGPASPPSILPKPKRWMLAVAALVFILVLLGALGLLLQVRRRDRTFSSTGVPGTGEEGEEKPGPANPKAAAPFIAFPCPSCSKDLRARAALAGKSLKCPQCGQGVLIPETNPGPLAPRASTGKLSILKDRRVIASVLVFAVVAGVCGWLFWPRRVKDYSFLNGTLGNQFVPEVEESGFWQEEYSKAGKPFRWTDGKGRLVIPIDRRKPPTGLVVELGIVRPAEAKTAWVQIVANNRVLFKQQIILWKWGGGTAGKFPAGVLDLTGIDLGDELVLDIISDTFVPKGEAGQRTLGVVVEGIELRREAPAAQ
jgi:hypothetical protein